MTIALDLVREVTDVVATLPPGRFLVIEYVARPHVGEPYAQLLPLSEGYYCEVVSEAYLPRAVWPIDPAWLSSAGWHEPDAETDNWWQVVGDARAAALAMLTALHKGRGCSSPRAYVWWTGQSPPPPDGGEPLPILELVAA